MYSNVDIRKDCEQMSFTTPAGGQRCLYTESLCSHFNVELRNEQDLEQAALEPRCDICIALTDINICEQTFI